MNPVLPLSRRLCETDAASQAAARSHAASHQALVTFFLSSADDAAAMATLVRAAIDAAKVDEQANVPTWTLGAGGAEVAQLLHGSVIFLRDGRPRWERPLWAQSPSPATASTQRMAKSRGSRPLVKLAVGIRPSWTAWRRSGLPEACATGLAGRGPSARRCATAAAMTCG